MEVEEFQKEWNGGLWNNHLLESKALKNAFNKTAHPECESLCVDNYHY